jgi:hypothetical protein
MTMKWGKVATNAVIIALLVTILMMLVRDQRTSGFEGAPILITPGKAVQKQPQSIFQLKNSLECTPGPGENASYLTQGLTPGGLCGDQAFVHDQLRDYAIADGIGGSLLEK